MSDTLITSREQLLNDLISRYSMTDDHDNLIVKGLKEIFQNEVLASYEDRLFLIAQVLKLINETCKHCWKTTEPCHCWNDD